MQDRQTPYKTCKLTEGVSQFVVFLENDAFIFNMHAGSWIYHCSHHILIPSGEQVHHSAKRLCVRNDFYSNIWTDVLKVNQLEFQPLNLFSKPYYSASVGYNLTWLNRSSFLFHSLSWVRFLCAFCSSSDPNNQNFHPKQQTWLHQKRYLIFRSAR